MKKDLIKQELKFQMNEVNILKTEVNAYFEKEINGIQGYFELANLLTSETHKLYIDNKAEIDTNLIYDILPTPPTSAVTFEMTNDIKEMTKSIQDIDRLQESIKRDNIKYSQNLFTGLLAKIKPSIMKLVFIIYIYIYTYI